MRGVLVPVIPRWAFICQIKPIPIPFPFLTHLSDSFTSSFQVFNSSSFTSSKAGASFTTSVHSRPFLWVSQPGVKHVAVVDFSNSFRVQRTASPIFAFSTVHAFTHVCLLL